MSEFRKEASPESAAMWRSRERTKALERFDRELDRIREQLDRGQMLEERLAALGAVRPTPRAALMVERLQSLLRSLIPFLEQWKRDDPSREARQWMDVREAMEAARKALTGEEYVGLSRGDEWAMEARTHTGFAAVERAASPAAAPPEEGQ